VRMRVRGKNKEKKCEGMNSCIYTRAIVYQVLHIFSIYSHRRQLWFAYEAMTKTATTELLERSRWLNSWLTPTSINTICCCVIQTHGTVF
jgi:hypothetical protein